MIPDLPKMDRTRLELAISQALEEDVGCGDVTTVWTVGERVKADATLIAKAPGVVAGLAVAEAVFQMIDSTIRFSSELTDGSGVDIGTVLAEVEGPARGILTGERTALNFLQRMSGIATATSEYVSAVSGTGTKILDTRKTVPGLRMLDKYSVVAGGGVNHRIGLFDRVLMKENHIEAADGIGPAVRAVKQGMAEADREILIEVEVETLHELEDALVSGVDQVMLDNMDLETMRKAVERVRSMNEKRPKLEASGNVTLASVREIAETGVDFISVGALTHSAKALDISLLFR